MGSFRTMAARRQFSGQRGGGTAGHALPAIRNPRGVLLLLLAMAAGCAVLLHLVRTTGRGDRDDVRTAAAFQSSVAMARNFFSERARQHPAVLLQGPITQASGPGGGGGGGGGIELVPTDGYYGFKSRLGGGRFKHGKKINELWSGEILLQFRKIPEGWHIHGTGRARAASPYRIEDGDVAHDGSGWWLAVDDRAKERTVVHGKFDFEKNDFQGSWRRNSLRGPSAGTFDMFELSEKLPSSDRPGPGRRESVIDGSGSVVD